MWGWLPSLRQTRTARRAHSLPTRPPLVCVVRVALPGPCRGAFLQTGVHSRSGGLSSTHCKPWQLHSFTPRLFFVPKRIRASVEAATSALTSQQSLKGYGTRGSGCGHGDVQSLPAYRMHHSTATTWRRDHGLNGLAFIDVSACAHIVLLVPPLCKCFACVEPRNNQSDYVRYRCTLSSHVRGPVGVLRYCKVQPTRPLLYTLKSKAT